MKPLTFICFLFFLTGVILGLLQMWLKVWDPELFMKILITDGALFVVTFVVAFLIKETRASEKINKGNSLD